MKRLFLFILVILLSFNSFTKPVRAQENWEIKKFSSNIVVNKSGLIEIEEEFSVDFGSEEKHGIYRDIPYIYQNSDGSKTYTEISISKVLRGRQTEKHEVFRDNGFVRIKIGDPATTVTSLQSYTIGYSVIGVLRGYDSYDELYWNVTGNNWVVPIESATATFSLPSEGVLQTACYQGFADSTEECKKNESRQTVAFESTRPLNIGEGMTIAVGYTKGLVPLLVGKAPKTVADDFLKPLNLLAMVLVFGVGLFLLINLWLRKGRDLWFGRNYLLGGKSQLSPVGANETIVVEYTSPENLRPAELASLSDEKAETLDVTATLVDLANRGFLSIEEEEKKWVFGAKDYIFQRSDKKTEALLEYEKELILRLFEDGDSVKMSGLKNKFYKDLAVVKDKLYQNLVEKKFFVENPSKVRMRYSLFAIILGVVGGGFIWLGFMTILGLFVMLGVVVILLSVIFLIIAQFMPARTALGRQMFARAKGYKLFIETAEKHRQRFFEKKNLFNEVLPYAIVFGLTEIFAKAFEKMGLEPSKPSWYHSRTSFSALAFGNALNSLSTTVSSSMASSPSSSGSGGGGSSGGGFGGGGGGSW